VRTLSLKTAVTLIATFLIVTHCAPFASAQTFTLLHSFPSSTNDGANPLGNIAVDAKGNVYGITEAGGIGGGAVFKVSANGTETILDTPCCYDGQGFYGGLIRDTKGNLYTVTQEGGTDGYGAVIEVAGNGTETVLYNFNGQNGNFSLAPPWQDAEGTLYGNTSYGGSIETVCGGECGLILKLTPSGEETVLHNFVGTDGFRPYSGVIADAEGNFYGTTESGGAAGYGTVYKLTAAGKISVLHSFTGGSDGSYSFAGLVEDKQGNLYGAASAGGTFGEGTIFKVTIGGKFSVLYTFTGGADGSEPSATLLLDSKGNLYGEASFGGDDTCFKPVGCGTVFELSPAGQLTVLHTFEGAADGFVPSGVLARDSAGNLYGTAWVGGPNGQGTVFKLTLN
jgi:uncharacterized repeat protein (TIGR03803 family)